MRLFIRLAILELSLAAILFGSLGRLDLAAKVNVQQLSVLQYYESAS